METDNAPSTTEYLDLGDLQNQYLTLRIGEEIPRLEVARLKRVTNPSKEDNLPGVDYKYVVEDTGGRALVINTWSLWRRVSAAFRNAGRIQTTLELKHPGTDDYRVRVVES